MRKPEAKKLTSERLQQFGFAYAPPLTISAAVNNKVFDTLQHAPKTVEQVTKETGGSPRGLRTIMDALVGLELLKKDRQSKYCLTPESHAFLISEKPGTIAGFFGSILPVMISRWLRLSEVVRDGRSAVAVNQETEETEFFSQVVETIIPMSYPSAQKLGDHLKIAKAKAPLRVLDVAAGSGIWGIALTQKSPRVRVPAVDWPGMIPTTKRITEKLVRAIASISSKATCQRRTLGTATMSRRWVIFCTAKVKNVVIDCSRKLFAL